LAATSLRRVRILAITSATLGVIGSHVIMIPYKVSQFDLAIEKMRDLDVFAYYVPQIQSRWLWLAPGIPQLRRRPVPGAAVQPTL
jgi:hypothetical protein